ncbi:3-carboxy-cis,cis-muconate cycloisomerase [Actinospica sp. MGRD01-02]|uniref:3-carboxy-cis,cis-muconate cycloisomerase n=1 Tax=Actinospica acidithermotolerans TaxID=2828514 RepID=A0A941EF29_9ACTN|nr:3-carboxy-cis,cis-muconate cycloisomerase [Actinospica acidithermotolerans]MBR7830222.1 3-carboxy-cis,cis-muconate cycloisomerase [Actinospica acidithermotolerans]
MTSPERAASALDLGLLAPGRAGSRVEVETGDGAYLQGLLDAEAALARAQSSAGELPKQAAEAITSAAQADRFDLRQIALDARDGGNPVIPLVAALRAAVPDEAAAYVHRGATSQDIMDTATMLVAHRTRAVILADLDRVASALATLAARHRATPMAGRTLTQHAVPTTFGLKVAGWRSLVLDARDRLAALALPAQLGGAAGTLAALADSDEPAAVLRLVESFAAESGLEVPVLPWHVLRTPIAELGGALALTAGALGKFAADVLVLGRTEIAEIRQSGGGAGGSSAMPHKANPVNAALIAATARQVPALAAVLYSAMAAEDERPAGAWHAEWQNLRQALRLVGTATELAAELAEGLDARPEKMAANLAITGGLIVSERLVGALEPLLGRSAARTALTAASKEAADGASLSETLIEQPEIRALIDADRLSSDELADLLDPASYLGAAPHLVDRALRRAPRATT